MKSVEMPLGEPVGIELEPSPESRQEAVERHHSPIHEAAATIVDGLSEQDRYKVESGFASLVSCVGPTLAGNRLVEVVVNTFPKKDKNG